MVSVKIPVRMEVVNVTVLTDEETFRLSKIRAAELGTSVLVPNCGRMTRSAVALSNS